MSLIGSVVRGSVGSEIESAAQAIEDYLGGTPDRTFPNDAGDLILMRGDKKIRFDINNYAPHDEPHFHIETQDSNGNWIDAGDQHWYPFSEE